MLVVWSAVVQETISNTAASSGCPAPARARWGGEQESRACRVKSRCILPVPSSRLMATGVSDASHMFPSHKQLLDSSLAPNKFSCFANWTTASFFRTSQAYSGGWRTGAAGSTMRLFIRVSPCVLKNHLKREKGPSRCLLLFSSGPTL